MNKTLELINNDIQELTKPIVVYVCGIGGAGKTTFAKNLKECLGDKAVLIQQDWYHVHTSSVRKQRMFDALENNNPIHIEAELNPLHWYNHKAFIKGLEKIKKTGSLVLKNVWDQKTGENNFSTNIHLPENGVIIVEGIYLLHSPVIDQANLTIYLEITPEIARKRAEQRDKHRSDREYLELKKKLMNKYDRPYFEMNKSNADFIVNNDNFLQPKIMQIKR